MAVWWYAVSDLKSLCASCVGHIRPSNTIAYIILTIKLVRMSLIKQGVIEL